MALPRCCFAAGQLPPGGDNVLLVRTEFTNTQGVYDPIGADCRGYPQWRRREGRPFLYKFSGKDWTIGPQLGEEEHFDCVDGEDTRSPLEVPDWTDEQGDVFIFEMTDVSTDDAPQVLSVSSNFRNLAGGYVRMAKDFDGYPAYHNEEQHQYLFHIRVIGAWRISDELSLDGNVYCECKSDLVDVVNISWENSKVKRVEEVTWLNLPSDSGFVDTGFPADRSSLGDSFIKQYPEYADPTRVEWVRAPQLSRDEKRYLFGEVHPSDIFQGKIGNCALISAISCVAEFPNAIQDLIHPKDIAHDGQYTVKLYDVQLGSWVDTLIDDLLPCETRAFWERYARPLFAYVKGACIWPMIIEKAVAKMCGSYAALSWGSLCWAWQALTGCEQQNMYVREPAGTWALFELNVAEQRSKMQSGERLAAPFYCTGKRLDSDQLWAELHRLSAANFLIGSHIVSSEEVRRDDGLVAGHSYSVMSTCECNGFCLIKLRNPWGKSQWNGAWCDDDDMWQEHEEVAEKLDPDNLAEGCFWMEWNDFVASFNAVSIAGHAMPHLRSQGQAQEASSKRGITLGATSLTSSRSKRNSTASALVTSHCEAMSCRVS
eukprot:TRINITY_DN31390_c0_g1_i2.p1 TRINITY_DN31390_c0_g1~~TRINITY_DN31390_c0_g1_i2.p1  ORF type:complete len:599 (-),score=88.24 TRINITY_DN31390_c0_g1_i2:93-1889(-)